MIAAAPAQPGYTNFTIPPPRIPHGAAEVAGCTLTDAKNFDPMANADDGSCLFPIVGCMNPEATNYNAAANVEPTTGYYACLLPPKARFVLNIGANMTENDTFSADFR